MNDLISRKAVLSILHNKAFDSVRSDEKYNLLRWCIKRIENLPTIQPQGIDKDRLIEELIDLLAKDCKDMELCGKIVGLISVQPTVQPTVQPQTGWIPCSSDDRLTERDCNGVIGFKGLMRYYNFNDFQKMARKLLYYEDLAEQGRLAYLPQPYKESE